MRTHLGKLFCLLLLVAVCIPLMGISSCEEKVMDANGVSLKQGPDGKWYTEVKDGPVQSSVKVAQGATEGTPLAPILAGASILTNLLQGFLKRRADAEANRRNAATQLGLQSFVDAHPPEVGHLLVAELDHAHDAAGIAPAHQDAIQPKTIPVPAAA